MPDLRDVELRIAVAEGVLSRAEADVLAEEARRKKQSPLALLVEQGRLSEDSFQSFLAEALNDPAWRAAGKDASASTYTMQAMPRPSDEPAFPVAAWDRYVNVRFLGQGGMGMVFLAIDTRLRREVAIKFVRGDNAEHVRRLIAEARTQARVSHDRICRVYEVGEVEGKVYIAMQYIEGTPLGRLAGELTLEQKAMVVRSAAEGLHEAHRAGIVHRDVKPSNIMVECGDDGELRPFVMDFGLARSAQEAGTTQTGAVLGTPRYMAPEQAQGDAAKLDRRADVYSLGATLYHLVTGEPAVPGDTIAEVIHNLITSEPRPLRAIDPGIPIDLEAIVLKCLEKDRAARYDSARALADDLDRFLNGEPVLARPAGTWYRLRKRLTKHRRLVAAAGTALLALIIAIGWAVKTTGEAAERERLARRFTEQVGGIESTALNSALSRLHDVRRDRTELRSRMDELAAEIRSAGDLAVGPGHYALGRGYLALGGDEQARLELEVAWRAGFQEPRAAYALALANGHLYQQGLLAAERIEDKDQREIARRAVIERYRKPALDYLERSESAGLAPRGYVAALTAFYKDDLDAALASIDRIDDAPAWFYDLPKLRGDILFARALRFRNSGDKERARAAFGEARTAYAAAVDGARSVPATYQSLAELEYAVAVMDLYSKGKVVQPLEQALSAAVRVLEASPGDYDALVLQARIRRSDAEYRINQGANVEDLLEAALAGARRAIEASPLRPEARLEMARVYRQWGGYRSGRHEDPSEQFRKAIAIGESVLSKDRDATYFMHMGLTYSLWADWQDDQSLDSRANWARSIETYTAALRLAQALHATTQERDIWLNLGTNSYKRASRPAARDPDGDLRSTFDAFDKARALDPQQFISYLYVGRGYALRAALTRDRGGDPAPDFERAVLEFRHGLAINSEVPYFHNGIGAVLQGRARAAWDRGERPEPLLEQAEAEFRAAIEVAPKVGYARNNVGEVFIQRAWFERERDDDPSADVDRAIAMVTQAIELIPKHETFRADLGMAYAIRAGYELDHGRNPARDLDLAEGAIHDALERAPRDALSRAYLGEILGLRARLLARQGHGDPADFERAAVEYRGALALAPHSQDYRIMFARFCAAWARFLAEHGRDPNPALDEGLTTIARALDRRPTWPDALVLRASLRLVQAERAGEPAERSDHAAAAAQDFARALTGNAALVKAWASFAERARQLRPRSAGQQ